MQTKDIFHPLKKPIIKPPKLIQTVIRKVGTFSPIAPYMSNVYEATYDANSLGFI